MSRWPTEPVALLLAPAPTAASAPVAAGAGLATVRVEAALAAWRQVLDSAALPPRRRVRCLLRDDLVRYRVVPWNERLSSPPARLALARQCFIDAFGEAARPWQVQIDSPRYGCASLAVAIDPRLLAGLGSELASRALRQACVEPTLVQAFNLERRTLPRRGVWFVLHHDAGLTLLLLRDGQPQHVKQVVGAIEALDRLIARESFALGLDAPDAPVHLARPPWLAADRPAAATDEAQPPAAAPARAAGLALAPLGGA